MLFSHTFKALDTSFQLPMCAANPASGLDVVLLFPVFKLLGLDHWFGLEFLSWLRVLALAGIFAWALYCRSKVWSAVILVLAAAQFYHPCPEGKSIPAAGAPVQYRQRIPFQR